MGESSSSIHTGDKTGPGYTSIKIAQLVEEHIPLVHVQVVLS